MTSAPLSSVTLRWHFHKNRKFVLRAHKAACPPSGLKGTLNNCLKAECMALDLCYHLLKQRYLRLISPRLPGSEEKHYFSFTKKKLMTPSCIIMFGLLFLKAAAIQEQLFTAKVYQSCTELKRFAIFCPSLPMYVHICESKFFLHKTWCFVIA